jgi:DNA-directed RNA polymerase I, II, and III subunit RPABC2|uniref:Uncharacterized protein n=1 Tax=viral metagenome TaxID=1070528 RepID=A0A6C0C0V0_9ZZZZ
MSLQAQKEDSNKELDDLASEIAAELDDNASLGLSDDEEPNDNIFNKQNEDSDVGSEIGSDIDEPNDPEEQDDSLKLKVDFDDEKAVADLVEEKSDDEYDDDYEEQMKKLESDFDNSILLDYHPELKQSNYTEISAMCKITRDSENNIVDPLHRTLPWLTKFEIARILGLRSKQINNGAEAFVDVPPSIISGYTIAEMELEQKKIPFILRRPMPNGGSEYWRVCDLDVIDI